MWEGIRNSEHGIGDSQCRIGDSEWGIGNSECAIREPECRIWDSQSWMLVMVLRKPPTVWRMSARGWEMPPQVSRMSLKVARKPAEVWEMPLKVVRMPLKVWEMTLKRWGKPLTGPGKPPLGVGASSFRPGESPTALLAWKGGGGGLQVPREGPPVEEIMRRAVEPLHARLDLSTSSRCAESSG